MAGAFQAHHLQPRTTVETQPKSNHNHHHSQNLAKIKSQQRPRSPPIKSQNHEPLPPKSQTTKPQNHKSKNQKITTKTQNHTTKTQNQKSNHTHQNQPTPSTQSYPDQPTKPPKSKTHQNQSKPLKLKLIYIKSQNQLTYPPQRPTMNHHRDPRFMKNHCSPTTPSITSWPRPRPTNLRCREKGKQRGDGERDRERK